MCCPITLHLEHIHGTHVPCSWLLRKELYNDTCIHRSNLHNFLQTNMANWRTRRSLQWAQFMDLEQERNYKIFVDFYHCFWLKISIVLTPPQILYQRLHLLVLRTQKRRKDAKMKRPLEEITFWYSDNRNEDKINQNRSNFDPLFPGKIILFVHSRRVDQCTIQFAL